MTQLPLEGSVQRERNLNSVIANHGRFSPWCGNLLLGKWEIATSQKHAPRDDKFLSFLVVSPPRDALLKEKESQHPV